MQDGWTCRRYEHSRGGEFKRVLLVLLVGIIKFSLICSVVKITYKLNRGPSSKLNHFQGRQPKSTQPTEQLAIPMGKTTTGH